MKPTFLSHFLTPILLFCGVATLPLQAQSYKDPTLSPEERTTDLLRRMTLEEKIAQIRHIHSWNIFDEQDLNETKLQEFVGDLCWGFVEGFPLTGESCHRHMRRIQEYMVKHTRLGIPVFTVAEALHGSVHEGSTIYPQNIALASTFNPELAYRRAAEISKELHYQGICQILAPCIDVVRDLRWGRVEESYGEDPFLNGIFAYEEAKGYLDNGISPMLKHYGPHGNPLGGLNLASVHCGVGELHDVYLQPFKRVVTSLPIHAVMSTYNSWNRVPNSSSHYLLTEVLRNRWGFQGYIYSDWGAIDMLHTFQRTASNQAEAAVQAIVAGLDVEASSECFPHLAALVKEKKVDEGIIDKAVSRVLLAKFRMGLFEDPYGDRFAGHSLHSQENIQVARQIADESTVLLKNDKDLLPLNLSQLKSIAVIGPNADQVQFGDYTWSRTNQDGITPLEGIRKQVEPVGIKIRYAKGCNMMSMDTTQIAAAVEAARQSDAAILFCGSASASLARDYHETNCGEGFDLTDLSLTGAQGKLIQAVHATGKPVVLVLINGRPLSINWADKFVPAILEAWYPGSMGGIAVADALFGDYNPGGKLTVTFPKSVGQIPLNFPAKPSSQIDGGKNPGMPGNMSRVNGPLYPFGYGLSYTTFEYSDLQVSPKVITPNQKVTVTCKVTNTGKRAGDEVVQLYLRDVVSSLTTYEKNLVGFERLHLKPGETKEVRFMLDRKDMELLNAKNDWVVEPGEFRVMAGASSEDIRLSDKFAVVEYGMNGVWSETGNSKGDVISASTEMQDVGMTLDNDLKTCWQGNKGDYIPFALENGAKIDGLSIAWKKENTGEADFEIQLSGGGGQFLTVYSGSVSKFNEWMSYTFKGTTASDLRILLNSDGLGVAEVKINQLKKE